MAKGEKQCVGCGNFKPVGPNGEFYKSANKGHKDGWNAYCKQCCKVNRGLESVRKRDRKNGISYRQEYRARELGVEMEEGITLAIVYRRHFGICALCKTWVQPKHASMDHTKPLSRGGTHTHDNVQLTHVKCNLRKGHRSGF